MATPWWAAGILSYLLLVRVLRYRNRSLNVQTYKKAIESKAGLDVTQAQIIMARTPMYETPFMASLSMIVALFKSYGIPSIASLLLRTGQLGHLHAGKRLADTSILLVALVFCPITAIDGDGTDPRGALALARVNWLHRQYKIKNDDMLYLLSKFLYEPIDWNEQFEWRGWTAEEKHAAFVYWKCIGERMNIHSIPDSYKEFHEWAEEYERANMRSCRATNELGAQAFSFALDKLPNLGVIRAVGREFLVALMPDRLRVSMGLPEPSRTMLHLVRGIFYARAFLVRHFFLPRRKPYEFCPMNPREPSIWATPSSNDPKGQRMHTHMRKREPWYYPPLKGRQLYLEKLLVRLGVKQEKYLPGSRYRCEGYRIEELTSMVYLSSYYLLLVTYCLYRKRPK